MSSHSIQSMPYNQAHAAESPAMTIGQRITEAREARELTRTQLCELAGLKYPTIAGIENGNQKTTTELPAIAKALGVSVEWLQTGRGPREASEADAEWITVKLWKQGLAAGDGAVADEYVETGGLKFKRASLQRKGLLGDRLAVLYASGDSMAPRIQDGDALLLDLSDARLCDDRVCAVQYDGHLYVKRLRKFGQQWFLVSDNTQDPRWRDPIAVDLNRDFQIIGHVRWIGGWTQ